MPAHFHGRASCPEGPSVWVPTRTPPGFPVACTGAVVGEGAVVVAGPDVVGFGADVVGLDVMGAVEVGAIVVCTSAVWPHPITMIPVTSKIPTMSKVIFFNVYSFHVLNLYKPG
jgi:hypothetical protein